MSDSTFQKSFDELLDEILTDWRSQFPEADTSQGSLIFIKSACMASALWGLYKYQTWIANQIFADSSDTDNLEHHAWVRGLARTTGETDAELLERYLDYIRNPPAGGNKSDYVKWAKEIDYVANAWCIPLGQGLGTVDVIILADEDTTGSELPSSHAMTGTTTSVEGYKLIDSAANFTDSTSPVRIGDVAVHDELQTTAVVTAIDSATQLTLDTDIFTETSKAYTLKSLVAQVKEHIEEERPVTALVVRVLPPTILSQDVSVTVAGTGIDTSAIATEISAYMEGLIPDETFYRNRIAAIAIQEGADNAVVSVPAADVVPGTYEMIRPGTVSVT